MAEEVEEVTVEELVEAVAKVVDEKLQSEIGEVRKSLAAVSSLVRSLEERLRRVEAAPTNPAALVETLSAGYGSLLRQVIKEATSGGFAVEPVLRKIDESAAALAARLEEQGRGIAELKEAVGQLSGQLERLSKAIESLNEALSKGVPGAVQQAVIAGMAPVRAELEKLSRSAAAKRIEELEKRLTEIGDKVDVIEKNLAELSGPLRVFADRLLSALNRIERLLQMEGGGGEGGG